MLNISLEDRNLGFEWLYWINNELLQKSDEAIKVLWEQLEILDDLDSKEYEKKKERGILLNKIAFHIYNNGNSDKALTYWKESYDSYQFISERNAIAGMLLLEKRDYSESTKFLLKHHDFSYDTQDGYRTEYGSELKKLYDKKLLDNEPTLIGLMFFVMRNEKEYFNLDGKLQFCERYLTEIETWAKKYPQNSLIWTTIGNSYYHDLQNYQKAFEAYRNAVNGDSSLGFINIESIHKAATNSKNNLLSLSFNFHTPTEHLYSALTIALSIANEYEKDKDYINYLKLALYFGEETYNRYRNYLYDGKGSEDNNNPHYFAMTCNNFSIAMLDYANAVYGDDNEEKSDALYKQAADIQIEGYNISPFYENIEGASSKYFYAKEYNKSIKYAQECIDIYSDDMDLLAIQDIYWEITYASIQLDDTKKAKEYYFLSKNLFNTYKKGNTEADKRFIYTAIAFFKHIILDKKSYENMLEEIEWYLNTSIEYDEEDLEEYGTAYLCLGSCYANAGYTNEAIKTLEKAIDILEDEDEELEDEAIRQLKMLKNTSGKSLFKKIKNIFS